MEQIRLVNISLNYQGSDVLLEVDEDTANILLNDPEAAETYLQQVINSTTFEVSQPNEDTDNISKTDNTVIWTSRKPTAVDGEATVFFLKLRAKYAKEFDDKKTVKGQIWGKIAEEMQQKYNLGENPSEKCRQKFSNLQKQYFSHISHVKKTGEKYNVQPPYFAEMHDILGGKDKSNPQNLQDSLEDINKTGSTEMTNPDPKPEEDNEAAGPSQATISNIRNRFRNVHKTEKPSSNIDKMLEFLHQQQEQDNKYRERHFETITNAMKTQQAQGDRLLNILENVFSKNKKRKRRNSSDESD